MRGAGERETVGKESTEEQARRLANCRLIMDKVPRTKQAERGQGPREECTRVQGTQPAHGYLRLVVL